MKIVVCETENSSYNYYDTYSPIILDCKHNDKKSKNESLLKFLNLCDIEETILIIDTNSLITCNTKHIEDKFKILNRDIVISVNPSKKYNNIKDYINDLNDNIIIGKAGTLYDFVKSTEKYDNDWILTIKNDNNKFNILFDIQYFLFYYMYKDENPDTIQSFGKVYVGKYKWDPCVISSSINDSLTKNSFPISSLEKFENTNKYLYCDIPAVFLIIISLFYLYNLK